MYFKETSLLRLAFSEIAGGSNISPVLEKNNCLKNVILCTLPFFSGILRYFCWSCIKTLLKSHWNCHLWNEQRLKKISDKFMVIYHFLLRITTKKLGWNCDGTLVCWHQLNSVVMRRTFSDSVYLPHTSPVPNFKPFDRLQQIWQWFTYMASPSALATMRFHPSPNKLPPLENYFYCIIVTFSVLYMNFFN